MEDGLVRLRVSSEPFAKRSEIDAVIEILGRNLLRIEMAAMEGHPLQLELLLRSLPGFAAAAGRLSPMRCRHPAELIDNDDLVLLVVQSGVSELGQYGRVATIKDGDAVLIANGAPASLVRPSHCRVIHFRFSRHLLQPHVTNLDDLVARPIAANNPVLRLLVGHADVLNELGNLATAELRHTVVGHMHDLAALLLGGKGEPEQIHGLRAARLKAVKDDVLRRIEQGDLSVSEVARSQQISERYLRKLFAAEGTTFTDFVRDARLEHAHRLLSDPSQLQRPINAIAYESGFGDLSYFNRAFRQTYNMTPSEARELAMRPAGKPRG